jgi:hypothetical protein
MVSFGSTSCRRHMLEVVASLNRYLQAVIASHTVLHTAGAGGEGTTLTLPTPLLARIQRELDRQAEQQQKNETLKAKRNPTTTPITSGNTLASNAVADAAPTMVGNPAAAQPAGAAFRTAEWAARVIEAGGPATSVTTDVILTQELKQRTFEEDVLAAEARVLEVSKMQSKFSIELAHQGEMIETILTDASTAKINVHEGNKHIRKAMDDSTTLRQSVVLFILMCSLILMVLELF